MCAFMTFEEIYPSLEGFHPPFRVMMVLGFSLLVSVFFHICVWVADVCSGSEFCCYFNEFLCLF